MSDVVNKKHFWSLDKDFYDTTENSGGGYYNSYSDFVKNSKIETNLKNFKYKNPFSFIPSYGASVSINFLNKVSNYGNNYLMVEEDGLNRIIITFELSFENRGDDESDDIISYINSKGGAKYFPLQFIERDGLSIENAYKSLFSINPYMIQEFKCSSISSSSNYVDSNSIKLDLINDLVTKFNSRNIIYSESLPQKDKDVINDYWGKSSLDIQPSYPLSRDEDFNVKELKLGNSKSHSEEDGINAKLMSLSLKFEAINDETLLKLLSFFISKHGTETFEFELQRPERKTVNFMCSQINHTFLYMGSHDLTVRVSEVPIKRKLL